MNNTLSGIKVFDRNLSPDFNVWENLQNEVETSRKSSTVHKPNNFQMRCCGVTSYKQWQDKFGKIPPSCCREVNNTECRDFIKDPLNPRFDTQRRQCESPGTIDYCLVYTKVSARKHDLADWDGD